MCSPTSTLPQQSIVQEVAPYVIAGVIGMHAVYTSIYMTIDTPDHYVWQVLPPVRPDLCLENTSTTNPTTNCIRPDLVSFSFVSFLTFIVCTALAFYGWYVDGCRRMTKTASSETRLYGYLPTAKWLTAFNLVYQLWDFGISFQIPEYFTPIMMTHHTVAATVAFSGLYCQMLSYYAVFFMGLSEVSSVWLVLCQLGQNFPPIPGTAFEMVQNTIFAPLFVTTFTYYRVVLWWFPISYYLFKDVRTVLGNGQADKLRPGTSWNLYLMLLLDIPMGCLQLYWFLEIAGKVQDLLLA